MKVKIGVALTASFVALALSATNSFASSCSRLEDFFPLERTEIVTKINDWNRNQLKDLRDNAKSCKSDQFVAFALKDGSPAKEDIAKNAAQKVLDALEQSPSINNNDLSAFNFSVGLGNLFLFSHHDITSTTVDNGTLRITGDEKYKLGLWLSTNSFLSESNLCLLYWVGCMAKDKPLRKGLFVAVQVGGSNTNTINSFALGLSFAARKQAFSSQGSAPLVFQIGYGWTHIQELASGYSDGMTMPTGANQPVLKNTIGNGPVFIVSYALN